MAQRRKIDVSVTDFDRNKPDVGLSFQNAANEVTKLYHQAMNYEHIAFDAGRKHSLAKVSEWISSQIQDGKSVTSADVIAYMENKLNDSAQGSTSSESQTSQYAQIEANSGSCCSAAPIESQEQGENVACSQEQAMDEDPVQV